MNNVIKLTLPINDTKPIMNPIKNQILAPIGPKHPSVKALSPLMTLLGTMLTMIMEMVEKTPHKWNTSLVSTWSLIEASRANHQPEKNRKPATDAAILFLFSLQSILFRKSGTWTWIGIL